VLFVVLARQRRGDVHEFHADDLQAATLEAGDDLPDEAALDGVGLCEDEGPLQVTSFLILWVRWAASAA